MASASKSSLSQMLTTPGYARSQFIRHVIGVILVFAAVVVALSGLRENPEILVFARDVDAGQELTAADTHLVRVPHDVIPDEGALHDPDEVVGRIITAPAVAGEFVTELRLLGDELTSQLVPGGHMVPLKLAEPDLISLLHHGDTVNVVSSQEDELSPGLFSPLTIAEGARVIATSADISAGAHASSNASVGSPATILLALPADQAQLVASASLSQPLTVVITGERAELQSTHHE